MVTTPTLYFSAEPPFSQVEHSNHVHNDAMQKSRSAISDSVGLAWPGIALDAGPARRPSSPAAGFALFTDDAPVYNFR